MLALVESSGSHAALSDKRERDLPNGVSANSPPPSIVANGAHQEWEQHDKKCESGTADFHKTELAKSPLEASAPRSVSPATAREAAAVVEHDEEEALLAAEAQAAAQLEAEEAADANADADAHRDALKMELDEEEPLSGTETPSDERPESKSNVSDETQSPSKDDDAAAEDVPDTGTDADTPSAAETATPSTPSPPAVPADAADAPASGDAPKRLLPDDDKTAATDEHHPAKKARRESANTNGEQSALDLRAPSKEASETAEPKRPSPLSKVPEKQESPAARRNSSKADGDEPEPRSDRIFQSASERAQVLREMRDRVLSSYKSERTPQQVQQPPSQEFSELERERLVSEAVEAAACSGKLADLEKAAHQLQNEIRKLSAEAHAKEMEWNQLIRKRKLKEEVFLRIHRRKQVLAMSGSADGEAERRERREESGKVDSDASEGSDVDSRENSEHRSGEELLAAALRLGSRNLEEYTRNIRASSPPVGATRTPAPVGATAAMTLAKACNGRQPLSLLQSQLSKPQELSPAAALPSGATATGATATGAERPAVQRPQLLLQHLQRQQRGMLLNNVNAPACRLSPSVSLSAIPTSSAPPSLPTAQQGVKCYLPSQGGLLSMDKSLSSTTSSACSPGGMASAGGPASAAAAATAALRARPILPKPTQLQQQLQQLQHSVASGGGCGTSGGSVVSMDCALGDGGGGVIGEGRQGPIVDVKSIIADYRSKHPEGVPRRGRRLKPKVVVPDSLLNHPGRPGLGNSGNLLSMSLPTLGCGGHVRTAGLATIPASALDLSELGLMLTPGGESPSRPSSTESTLSGAAPQDAAKDVLLQFAKLMSQAQAAVNTGAAPGSLPLDAVPGRPPPPPYPEVTLHPVLASSQPVSSSASSPTTSLLHGILTKPSAASAAPISASGAGPAAAPASSKPTTFSPTLARLLTAPERTSHLAPPPPFAMAHPGVPSANAAVSLNDLLATAASKARSELTITPVGSPASKSAHIAPNRTKSEVMLVDEDEGGGGGAANGEDADGEGDDDQRLVIDESAGVDSPCKEPVPACQSCHTREAEFVCAGCTNQWYCSRECQIAAWDQHSEVCSL